MTTRLDISTCRVNVARSTSSPARAFTLIELLVVVSIIALLVAILLPALSAARDTARSVECLSRLRQFGTWITVYHNDYGVYPTAQRRSVPGKDWLSQIGTYVDPGQDNHTNSAGMWNRSNPTSVNFFLCPGRMHDTTVSAAAVIREWAAIDSWRVHNYRIQAFFGRDRGILDPGGSGRDPYNTPPKTELYGDLSRVAMVAGIKGANHARWGWIGSTDYYRDVIFPHPGETSNWLFVDGHARNVGTVQDVVQQRGNGQIQMRPDRFSTIRPNASQYH